MPTGKITKSSVEAITVAKGSVILWDSELKGFGCKVTAAGRRVYLCQYRLNGRAGDSQRVTLGVHGNLTADEARTRAKRILGQVADGGDVAKAKREAKAAKKAARTVAEVADLFMAQHAKVHVKASTQAEYARLIEKQLSRSWASALSATSHVRM